MKFFVPLFALVALAFPACSTDANRRALYSPKKADGYWTHSLEDGSYLRRKSVAGLLPGEATHYSEEEVPDRRPGWRIRQWKRED